LSKRFEVPARVRTALTGGNKGLVRTRVA
jgi:hypothetical protein